MVTTNFEQFEFRSEEGLIQLNAISSVHSKTADSVFFYQVKAAEKVSCSWKEKKLAPSETFSPTIYETAANVC